MKTKKVIKRFSLVLFMLGFLLSGSTVFADGLIVINKPQPGINAFPLQVLYHYVDVSIDGQIAVTSIDQSFYNPTDARLEGYYIFPIPKGAVIKNFEMEIDGKKVPAELLDATKARQIYEDIVRRMRDPALLEYSEQSLFRVRIYPIEPRSEKKVTISYTEVIAKDNGMFEYTYPLNTEKFSSKPVKDVVVRVNIKAGDEIKNVYCPTHNVDVVREDDNNVMVSYEEENVKPDTDFKVYFNTNNNKVGMSLLTSKKKSEDGYFFLSLSPEWKLKNKDIIEKDITFVLDVSGSMAGDKLRYAKSAITYCIENLNDGDRFEIIKFSTEAYGLFNKLVDADFDNKDKAEKFVKDLKPIGGTNIEEAIELALKDEHKSNRPHMIIFITDGKPTIGETNEDKLVSKIQSFNENKTRIFTFGIGDEINTHLLDKIAVVTNASRIYTSPSIDIEMKISSFYDKVQSPVLTNLKLDFGDVDVYQMYPKNLPDLFRGSNLTIFGRYRGNGKTNIMLTGYVDGEKKEYKLMGNFVKNNITYDFIPPLWASRRIGYLLDLIRLHGEEKELVDEVTALARAHGIITPYTSYLILEDEEANVRRNVLPVAFQTIRGTAAAPSIASGLKQEYNNIKERSGALSVQASEEVRDLNKADNLVQTEQGKKRLEFKLGKEQSINLTKQVRNVQGRAFYQSGEFWVDSKLHYSIPQETKQIKFGSDEYFNLLNSNSELGQYLALGQNVRFLFNNTQYEIIN